MSGGLLRILSRGFIVFSVAILLTVPSAAATQESGRSGSEGPRLVLGGTSGVPGAMVVVPVYFAAVDGVEVGSLKLHITFVSVNLKYQKVETGVAAEIANVAVSGDAIAGKDDKGLETTTITVSAAAPSGAQKGIPGGLLAYITMRINETGRPATIALHTKVDALGLDGKRELENIASTDANVDVIAPGSEPAVNCFFFTH